MELDEIQFHYMHENLANYSLNLTVFCANAAVPLKPQIVLILLAEWYLIHETLSPCPK